MGKTRSGYDRSPLDRYETPPWVTRALLAHLRLPRFVIEPACGSGKMAKVLTEGGHVVLANDIEDVWSGQEAPSDFLSWNSAPDLYEAIVTNPPYGRLGRLAEAFIKQALSLMKLRRGMVAMLLPADFDHPKSRRYLFADHPAFAGRIVIHKRIRWIEGSTGHPSQNHCWFLWDWRWKGAPMVTYLNDNDIAGAAEALEVA